MASALERVNAAWVTRDTDVAERRFGIDGWISDYLLPANQVTFGGNTYPFGLNQTFLGTRTKEISSTLSGYLAALRMCPPAYAAQMVRALVLSQARFIFRNNRTSRTPGRTFGTQALAPLETPWPNGTTGELLARMEWHAGLAGNAYVTNRQSGRLRVLRPDWVTIVYGSQQEPDDAAHALDGEIIGYAYCNGGINQGRNRVFTLLPDEVAHWSPLPDPEGAGIGMSWITPAVREIQGDRAATDHKLQFFANGAPQPYDAGVLTPDGWVEMGSIKVGDRVFGSDGKPKTVLAVYPQGIQDIYRVTFSSGGSTECTADHLWTVANAYDRKRDVTRTVTLADLVASGIHYDSGPFKWSVPLVDPVEFDDPGDLPIDPYLLGSLLGDGSFRSNGKGSGGVSMASHRDDADEQVAILTPLLPDDVRIVRRDRGGWSEFYFRGPGGPRTNPLTDRVRRLGLFDKPGHEKEIPGAYLRASVNQRVALLQGLLDTDGSVQRRQPNTVRFDSTSERLARQVGELAGGLGAIATVKAHRLATDKSRAQWRVSISRLPEWIAPCRLARKAVIYRPEVRGGRWRYIQSVEHVGRKPAQCIGVDSDDHLYVTDDFILTHNTPNLVVKGVTAASREQFDEIVSAMEAQHAGLRNAYRTLYLAAGADATVVGANLRDLDLKSVNGSAETRISMLSRVHPTILGASEGLSGSSLNAGNFGAARRMWADSWIYPTLQDVAAALAPLIRVPPDAELWTTTTDMPILREDAKDAADIEQVKATTINTLVTAGFTKDSIIAAVMAQDMSLLVDSGLVSVQLQPPGSAVPTDATTQAVASVLPPPPAARAIERRRFNPDEPRLPAGGPHGGEWGHGGAGGVIKDVLKLAGRIDLDEGEVLTETDKMSGSLGSVRLAATTRDGEHLLRIGVGAAGFGSRGSLGGPWKGGPDKFAATNAERAKLRAEADALESGPSTPESAKRLDELDQMDLSPIESDGATTRLKAADVAKFRTTVADAVDKGAAHNAADEALVNRHEAAQTAYQKFVVKALAGKGSMSATDAEQAQRLYDEAQALGDQVDRIDYNIPPFAQGSIPGDWGDLHYRVEIDDPTEGVQTYLGVVPRGSKETLESLMSNDQAARFNEAEIKKLLRMLGDAGPKVPAPTAARSRAEGDEPDEATRALIEALAWFDEPEARDADFEAKHHRGPGGRFATMVDRLINAIAEHKAGGGKGDPFAGFNREQLRRAAKARGIELKRGEDRDSIAAKLLADLGGSVKTSPAKKATKAVKKPEAPKPATEADVLAGDFSGLKRVGEQTGFNEGGLFKADDGSLWYVKSQQSLKHAQNEKLAASLYQATGLEAPSVTIGKGTPDLSGDVHTATKYLDGAKPYLKRIFDGRDQPKNDAFMHQVRSGFAVDAWLANWDTIGENPAMGKGWDNIVSVKGPRGDLKPARVDSGGALLFRGTGGPKGDAFGPVVTEWDKFRDPASDRRSSQVFRETTHEELAASVAKVQGVTPAKIRELVKQSGMDKSVADALIKRRADLISRMKAESKPWGAGATTGGPALAAAPESLKTVMNESERLGAFNAEGKAAYASYNALKAYQNGGYAAINQALLAAKGGTISGPHAKDIRDIDRVMDKSKLTHDVIVYRGERNPARNFAPGVWSLTGGMEGMEWTFHAYASTSTSKTPAKGFTEKTLAHGTHGAHAGQRQATVMRILVPKGTRAIDMRNMEEEREMLLARGLRYRVVKDYGVDKFGIRNLDVEVVTK